MKRKDDNFCNGCAVRQTAIFRDSLFLEHDPGFDQIENPERLRTLYQELDQLSLGHLFSQPVFGAATLKTLLLNHLESQHESVRKTSGKFYSVLDEDTFTSPKSYDAACLAVGALTTGLEMLRDGLIDNGFALVRPPGHHAEKDKSMGFCLFNNIAVAANYAQTVLGFKKIMIVDWDVHHGNGTQNAFFETDRVLYLSIHQSPLYPGTGALEEVGEGEGEGYTVNIPLPGGQGDLEYANIFNTVIKPIGKQYKPDLILVSAGFDGHYADGVSSMCVTHQGYGYMARVLVEMAEELCQGKIFMTLEGGYDLSGLKEGVFAVLAELIGTTLDTEFPCNLEPHICSQFEGERRDHPAIHQVVDIAKKYWSL